MFSFTLSGAENAFINTLVKKKVISIYGVDPILDKSVKGYNGVGILYNTETVKIKAEGDSDSVKTAAVVKYRPEDLPVYFKTGVSYLSEDQTKNGLENITQYSGGLALGYALSNTLYTETGICVTDLSGQKDGSGSLSYDQTTKEAYLEIAKRVETPIGALNGSVESKQIYKILSQPQNYYSGTIHYFPGNALKLGCTYTESNNYAAAKYSIRYGYFVTEYTDYISRDTNHIAVGLNITFTDIGKISTYKPPIKINPKLSTLKVFDDLILNDTMKLRM